MNHGLLLQPNVERLSDSVIGVVVARRPAPPSYLLDPATPYAPNKPPQQRSSTKSPATAAQSSSQIAHPVERTGEAMAQPSPLSPSGQPHNRLWCKLSTAEMILMMHRRRRCLTQRRYRKKIEDKASSLSNEVARLRDEVQELKVRKSRVLNPAVPRTNPLRLVVEYFHRFRHGLDLQQPLDEEHAQKNFLQRVVASDVASNGGFGVQTMLDEWRTLSLCHDNLEVALVKLNYGAKYVIVADVKIATTITEPALHKALAGMNADDKETNLPMLAWKLLGQRLVLPGTVRFEWDEANCQFSSVFSQVDMLRPLMRLLGTVAETSIVLNCALGIAA